MSDRVPLSPEMVESLCTRVDASPLQEEDRRIIKAVMRDYLLLGQAFIHKADTIHKLLRMIFGPSTEKAAKILPDFSQPKGEKPKPKGHGRKEAASYTGEKIAISHTLKTGDVCPECAQGKVYPTAPGVTPAAHPSMHAYGSRRSSGVISVERYSPQSCLMEHGRKNTMQKQAP